MQPIESFVADLGFPCVGAKTALSKGQIVVFQARDLRCPADDVAILDEVYDFIDRYEADKSLYASLIITFAGPNELSEEEFEKCLWVRLQALHNIDARRCDWDTSVSSDPSAPNFSLSFGGHAFYVVGLHPGSSRKARRFSIPALVLNLHEQFEELRVTGAYEKMQKLIRRRDHVFSGSVNPMLANFGDRSEARQYSGRVVEDDWTCPFAKVSQ